MDEKGEENMSITNDEMIGKLVFDRYKILKRLGAGSFGCIYSAEYENQLYAIKLEERDSGRNLLENEAYVMSYLNGPGLPAVKSYGYSSRHNILIMELMGKSLEDIFESFVVKKMTTRCVCNIGYQMMEIMEYIHNKHIIHRDIKPDNFVIGRGNKKKYIYILDFGLAKKYRSSRTLKQQPIVKGKNLTGTARYASINALNGLTQSRRDDLEAIGYVLMYFLRGRLPWQGIPVKNKEERYRKIMEKKIETTPEELCKGFPEEFMNYVHYTRNLEYEQEPDYNFLKNLFITVLKKNEFIIDCYYDWDRETIHYFRDFKNFKKKEHKDNKENNNNFNTNNEISTINDKKNIFNSNTNNITMNNVDNTFLSNKNNNIILSNNILNTEKNENGVLHTDAGGVVDTEQNQKNEKKIEYSVDKKINNNIDINYANDNYRKSIEPNNENINNNNFNLHTDNNIINNNINNNNVGENKKTKKLRREKEDGCCTIF